MRQAAGRGEALTRQLLAFARRLTLAPEPINLRSLIDGMRILVGGAPRGDITVDVDLDPKLWPVMADPGQLEPALLNLAVNARDATPSGGALKLAARNERLEGAGANGTKGEFVRIEVRDTGSGIPPDIMDRIFDPFYNQGGWQGHELGPQPSLRVRQPVGRTHRSPERCRTRCNLHPASSTSSHRFGRDAAGAVTGPK